MEIFDRDIFNKIFALADPFRIIADLSREEEKDYAENEESAKSPRSETISQSPGIDNNATDNITKGLSLFKINKETKTGRIKGFALLADPKILEITPVISVPEIKGSGGKSLFGAIFGFFGLGDEKPDKYSHFAKKRVSSFVKATNSIAGINGSFFYGTGTPVGVLVVNGQIISSPLLNRTAFIMYKDGRSTIDSVRMEGYLKLPDGETVGFSGVNQPISKDEIIIYTPDYQSTDPSDMSCKYVVVNGRIESMTNTEIKIPRNGFIVSANGSSERMLKARLKNGDELKWFFMASPPLEDILHVVAGGPRLVYNGEVCITSTEEKFKKDVAKSRAARTAVGITESGNIILLTVENNGKDKGATLEELAELLIELGATEGMNLDGGGSTSMVVNGSKLISGGERAVSNAIVIRARSL